MLLRMGCCCCYGNHPLRIYSKSFLPRNLYHNHQPITSSSSRIHTSHNYCPNLSNHDQSNLSVSDNMSLVGDKLAAKPSRSAEREARKSDNAETKRGDMAIPWDRLAGKPDRSWDREAKKFEKDQAKKAGRDDARTLKRADGVLAKGFRELDVNCTTSRWSPNLSITSRGQIVKDAAMAGRGKQMGANSVNRATSAGAQTRKGVSYTGPIEGRKPGLNVAARLGGAIRGHGHRVSTAARV
jgi:hypothetical protein